MTIVSYATKNVTREVRGERGGGGKVEGAEELLVGKDIK